MDATRRLSAPCSAPQFRARFIQSDLNLFDTIRIEWFSLSPEFCKLFPGELNYRRSLKSFSAEFLLNGRMEQHFCVCLNTGCVWGDLSYAGKK